MSKSKTFADKAKGKVKADTIAVKCIFSVKDEQTGGWKFRESIRKVHDVAEIEKLEILKG